MRIHLNPHRLRHHCMVVLSHEFGMDLEDIKRIMATTVDTLTQYAKKTTKDIAVELAEKGW